MKNEINVKIWAPKREDICKVYLIDKDGHYITRTGFTIEDIDEETMLKCDEVDAPTQLKPKWNREKKEWTEGASEEELSARLESLKSESTESIKSQTSSICLSIASELEQSNWINFPEDYDPEEIEEKKNQIREIRTRGREIREKIDAAQSLEELSQVDMNLIPIPEPEVVEEPSE